MNIISKMYCRIFQFCFHLALPILPYREPKIYKNVADIVKLLKKNKVQSVLLVTDSGLRSSGSTVFLENLFKKNNIHLAVYDKTCANPTVYNVEDARKVYIEQKCKCIIAFGGGSSMDCAKAVGARIAYPKRQVNQLKVCLKFFTQNSSVNCYSNNCRNRQ